MLPAVQVNSGSTDGELGAALLMIGLGALVSMRLTGHLVDRFGAGVLPVVMVGFAAAGVLPAFAGSPVALGAALLLLGALSGATDVAINAAGVHAEIRSQRALMNLAHAWFSVGVVVASLNTAALRAAGAGPRPVLGAVFVLVTVITVFALIPGVLPAKGKPARHHQSRSEVFGTSAGWNDVASCAAPDRLRMPGRLGLPGGKRLGKLGCRTHGDHA